MPIAPSPLPLAATVDWLVPHAGGSAPDDHPAQVAWQRHLDAGRIGRPPAMPPESLARIAAMEAILRAGRRGAVR